MSFWNFLGGFAVFNMICDWFSDKSQPDAPSFQPRDGDRSDWDEDDLDALDEDDWQDE